MPDRFVLPALSAEDIAEIASARHSMDAYAGRYIHQQLGYRFSMCRDGGEAGAIERQIRRGEWEAGKPLLDPSPATVNE